MMKKAVLHNVRAAMFDLDGTLFDSVGVWMNIDEKFLGMRGKTPTPEYKRAIAGLNNAECAEFTVEFYGLPDTPESLLKEWHEMAHSEYAKSVKLMPHAEKYVKDAFSRGIKIYAVTSLDGALAETGLMNNGIRDCFSGIVGAGELGLSKRNPEIYLHAAAVAGESPRSCVMFDDIAEAARAARKAGFISVAVRNEKSYDDGAKLDADCADYCVDSFAAAPLLLND